MLPRQNKQTDARAGADSSRVAKSALLMIEDCVYEFISGRDMANRS